METIHIISNILNYVPTNIKNNILKKIPNDKLNDWNESHKLSQKLNDWNESQELSQKLYDIIYCYCDNILYELCKLKIKWCDPYSHFNPKYKDNDIHLQLDKKSYYLIDYEDNKCVFKNVLYGGKKTDLKTIKEDQRIFSVYIYNFLHNGKFTNYDEIMIEINKQCGN
jgi:hypothetical protein